MTWWLFAECIAPTVRSRSHSGPAPSVPCACTANLVRVALPESRYVRRLLFSLAAVCLIALALAEYLLLPADGPTTEDLKAIGANAVGNLLTSLIAFLAVAGVLTWLLPKSDQSDEVRVVTGRDRNTTLEDGRRAATFWWFTGGLGRFNRSVLVPELAAAARRSNASRSVVLLTLDPDDSTVCQTYAELRSARRSGHGVDWTAESVRREILATVLACHQSQAREPLLELEIRFKSACALTRLEVTDLFAIRTSEDPSESALVFPKDVAFYSLMREDFRLERKQSREFNPTSSIGPALDPQYVRSWLRAGGVSCVNTMSDDELQQVVALAAKDGNPYV